MRSLTKQETTAVSGGIFDIRAPERNQGFGGNPFINQPWDMMDRMSLQGGDGDGDGDGGSGSGSGGGSGGGSSTADNLSAAADATKAANDFCKDNPEGKIEIEGVNNGVTGGVDAGKFGGLGGTAGQGGFNMTIHCCPVKARIKRLGFPVI